MIILLAASIALVSMVMKLAHRVCWRLNYEPITDGDQYWNALKQLLPLAAFPILFFIFILPVLIFHIYIAKTSRSNEALEIAAIVFLSLWSMASGMTLMVHIFVVRCLGTREVHRNQINLYHAT